MNLLVTEKRRGFSLRWHVLNDAVKQVEALVVIGLGGNQLLEHSQQPRLNTGIKRSEFKDKPKQYDIIIIILQKATVW